MEDKNVQKVELTISKKSFKGEDGKEHEYIAYEMELDGQTFALFPRKEDKKLIAYILKDLGMQ